jgi:recombination protein RecA
MAKAKTNKSTPSVEDTLADLFDDDSTYTLDDLDAPIHVNDWVSTGSSILDLYISNVPNGGIPVGKITEFTGLEQSGKSLICAHILADTQRQGGVGILIDTEMAVHSGFFRAIGIDPKRLHITNANTVEQIFAFIEDFIERVRKKDTNKLVTIVVDSVAGATTEREMASDYSKDGYATDKAIIISKALRKITKMIGTQRIALVFTNQLRQKMNAQPFSDQWTTSGGKSIGFHSSVRVRLNKGNKIKVISKGGKVVVGLEAKAKITKNRLGPPERECTFNILFDRGIDDYGSWMSTMKSYGIGRKKGSYWVYDLISKETGEVIEEWQFQSKDFVERMENDPIMKQAIYSDICDELIMIYVDRNQAPLPSGEIIEPDDSEDE